MQHKWQATWLLIILLSAGCSSRPATVGLQGQVNFDGQAIAWGKIDLLPVENTPGASACSPITNGRYEIPAKWGVLSNGVYQVRIAAFRNAGKKERVAGQLVDTAENFIPPAYNTQSTLKMRVSDLPDKNKADFQLGRSSTAAQVAHP
jgi:hypothetical protein